MQLTFNDALALRDSLVALDGYQRTIKNGETEQAVQMSYKFSGRTRLKIGRNLARLKPELEAHSAAVAAKFREISGGMDQLDPRDEGQARKITQFRVESEEMGGEAMDVSLIVLSESELQLDENPIPGTVLAGLDPIIEVPTGKCNSPQ